MPYTGARFADSRLRRRAAAERPGESADTVVKTTDRSRVLMVCELDGYANGVKPVEVVRFLRNRGHEVTVANTYYLSRASSDSSSLASKLPRPGLRRAALYAVEAASRVFTRGWRFGRRRLFYHLFLANYRLRRSILRSSLPLDDFDMVICEHPRDAGVLTVPTSARTLYDCPTPFADEMYFENSLTERQRDKLRRIEADLFESVDYLSFAWETYAGYAMDHYGISGRNLMQLNWGCTPAAERAEFSDPPRVICLSSLSSNFINLPLLSRLTKLYPHIDVYGGPPPDPALGLNYLGWAPPTILRDYQLGLITSSKDPLRQNGFSAKHMHYISYGLPVLVPVWRHHMHLLRGSVGYDENAFPSVVRELSNEEEWRRVSDEAYAQAQRLTWEQTLRPLDAVLSGGKPHAGDQAEPGNEHQQGDNGG